MVKTFRRHAGEGRHPWSTWAQAAGWVTASAGMTGKKMEKRFWVYIMASQFNGTLYIGMTSDLKKRTWEHKNGVIEGFTEKYGVSRLVYFEEQANAEAAITRERQMKEWKRDWKKNLIEHDNPHWDDLYEAICK